MTSTATEVSQSQSLAATRNFVRVAVSCVTYLRGLCSDDSYKPRQFLGLQLKQLVPSSTEAGAISRWMEEGAFDALNKGYLKELSLCIYTPNCAELLERYSFMFSYSSGGRRAALSFTLESPKEDPSCPLDIQDCKGKITGIKGKRRSHHEVRQALANIITKLMEVVEGLPPLLCTRVITMQLRYYEDVTPSTYEPPLFAPATPNVVEIQHRQQNGCADIATLDTGHHALSISIGHRFFDQLRAHYLVRSDPCDAGHSPPHLSPVRGEGGGAAAYGCTTRAGATDVSTTKANGSEWTRADEVAFLVFSSFVLARSPTVSRGRITLGEIEEYLRIACPMEIELKQAQLMMRSLEARGIVSLGAQFEWVVSEHRCTASLATEILECSDAASLLSAQTRKDLQRLASVPEVPRNSASRKRKRARA